MAESNWDDFRDRDNRPVEPTIEPAIDPTIERVPHSSVGLQIVVAMLLVAAAIAIYLAFLRPAPAPVSTVAPVAGTRSSSPQVALGGPADAVDVPPLDRRTPSCVASSERCPRAPSSQRGWEETVSFEIWWR